VHLGGNSTSRILGLRLIFRAFKVGLMYLGSGQGLTLRLPNIQLNVLMLFWFIQSIFNV
jgi:hypothetical protein